MPQLSRLFQALGVGYLGDLALGWTAIWLAPLTSDKTFRFYMAPGNWVADPLNAPFVALLFWTSLFGAAYFAGSQIKTRFRTAHTA
jgi:hypothetical protein